MQDLREKNILVTGGTGFIGKSLCQKLVDHGAHIFILTRGHSGRNSEKVTCINSISDVNGVEPEIIINLAGEPIAQRWTASIKDKIRKSRLETTASIIEYIKSSTRKPRLLISASAIGYYGIDERTEFDEATAPNMSGGRFARELCADWENEAAKAVEYGVRTVLLRLGAVLEKDGGMLGKLITPFRLGLGGPIGPGRQWLSWIDRNDLIDLILQIINTPGITGAINATAPSPVSNEIFSKTLANVLGKPCLLRTPAFALRFAFGDMADEIMLHGQKVLPRKAIASGFIFSYPTLESSLQKIFKINRTGNK